MITTNKTELGIVLRYGDVRISLLPGRMCTEINLGEEVESVHMRINKAIKFTVVQPKTKPKKRPAKSITTTLSFRSAWEHGIPHHAGQGVRAVPRARSRGDGWEIYIIKTGEYLGICYHIPGLRHRGGVLRRGECQSPRRPRRGD